MSEAGESRKTTSSRRRSSKRRSRVPRIIGLIWSEWRVELFIVLIVALAIFLLVERMQIRETLLGWARSALETAADLGGGAFEAVARFVRNTTLSDLVGYGLLLVAVLFVGWRVRWRLMTSPRLTTQKCPVCNGEIHRIRRRTRDRILNILVPVRRYRCKSSECRWQGLRVGRSRLE